MKKHKFMLLMALSLIILNVSIATSDDYIHGLDRGRDFENPIDHEIYGDITTHYNNYVGYDSGDVVKWGRDSYEHIDTELDKIQDVHTLRYDYVSIASENKVEIWTEDLDNKILSYEPENFDYISSMSVEDRIIYISGMGEIEGVKFDDSNEEIVNVEYVDLVESSTALIQLNAINDLDSGGSDVHNVIAVDENAVTYIDYNTETDSFGEQEYELEPDGYPITNSDSSHHSEYSFIANSNDYGYAVTVKDSELILNQLSDHIVPSGDDITGLEIATSNELDTPTNFYTQFIAFSDNGAVEIYDENYDLLWTENDIEFFDGSRTYEHVIDVHRHDTYNIYTYVDENHNYKSIRHSTVYEDEMEPITGFKPVIYRPEYLYDAVERSIISNRFKPMIEAETDDIELDVRHTYNLEVNNWMEDSDGFFESEKDNPFTLEFHKLKYSDAYTASDTIIPDEDVVNELYTTTHNSTVELHAEIEHFLSNTNYKDADDLKLSDYEDFVLDRHIDEHVVPIIESTDINKTDDHHTICWNWEYPDYSHITLDEGHRHDHTLEIYNQHTDAYDEIHGDRLRTLDGTSTDYCGDTSVRLYHDDYDNMFNDGDSIAITLDTDFRNHIKSQSYTDSFTVDKSDDGDDYDYLYVEEDNLAYEKHSYDIDFQIETYIGNYNPEYDIQYSLKNLDKDEWVTQYEDMNNIDNNFYTTDAYNMDEDTKINFRIYFLHPDKDTYGEQKNYTLPSGTATPEEPHFLGAEEFDDRSNILFDKDGEAWINGEHEGKNIDGIMVSYEDINPLVDEIVYDLEIYDNMNDELLWSNNYFHTHEVVYDESIGYLPEFDFSDINVPHTVNNRHTYWNHTIRVVGDDINEVVNYTITEHSGKIDVNLPDVINNMNDTDLSNDGSEFLYGGMNEYIISSLTSMDLRHDEYSIVDDLGREVMITFEGRDLDTGETVVDKTVLDTVEYSEGRAVPYQSSIHIRPEDINHKFEDNTNITGHWNIELDRGNGRVNMVLNEYETVHYNTVEEVEDSFVGHIIRGIGDVLRNIARTIVKAILTLITWVINTITYVVSTIGAIFQHLAHHVLNYVLVFEIGIGGETVEIDATEEGMFPTDHELTATELLFNETEFTVIYSYSDWSDDIGRTPFNLHARTITDLTSDMELIDESISINYYTLKGDTPDGISTVFFGGVLALSGVISWIYGFLPSWFITVLNAFFTLSKVFVGFLTGIFMGAVSIVSNLEFNAVITILKWLGIFKLADWGIKLYEGFTDTSKNAMDSMNVIIEDIHGYFDSAVNITTQSYIITTKVANTLINLGKKIKDAIPIF